MAGAVIFSGAVNVNNFRGTDANPDPRGGNYYNQINDAYKNDVDNPSPGTTPTDSLWNTIKLTHDPASFVAGLATKPPVLMLGSPDDTTSPIADQQGVATAYGSNCTYMTLPSGQGGHFSPAFQNDPYKTAIHNFIDGLSFS